MIDKTLERITHEISEELNIPVDIIAQVISQQHDDILKCAKNKEIDFIFLKYFGTFASHANKREPFRNDKHTNNG